VGAFCFWGVVLGVLLAYAGVVLYGSPLTITKRLVEVSSGLPFTVVAGGVLGAAEGVVLAFPLAAVLGRLGAEH